MQAAPVGFGISLAVKKLREPRRRSGPLRTLLELLWRVVKRMSPVLCGSKGCWSGAVMCAQVSAAVGPVPRVSEPRQTLGREVGGVRIRPEVVARLLAESVQDRAEMRRGCDTGRIGHQRGRMSYARDRWRLLGGCCVANVTGVRTDGGVTSSGGGAARNAGWRDVCDAELLASAGSYSS